MVFIDFVGVIVIDAAKVARGRCGEEARHLPKVYHLFSWYSRSSIALGIQSAGGGADTYHRQGARGHSRGRRRIDSRGACYEDMGDLHCDKPRMHCGMINA
jgi:hypothetical protein